MYYTVSINNKYELKDIMWKLSQSSFYKYFTKISPAQEELYEIENMKIYPPLKDGLIFPKELYKVLEFFIPIFRNNSGNIPFPTDLSDSGLETFYFEQLTVEQRGLVNLFLFYMYYICALLYKAGDTGYFRRAIESENSSSNKNNKSGFGIMGKLIKIAYNIDIDDLSNTSGFTQYRLDYLASSTNKTIGSLTLNKKIKNIIISYKAIDNGGKAKIIIMINGTKHKEHNLSTNNTIKNYDKYMFQCIFFPELVNFQLKTIDILLETNGDFVSIQGFYLLISTF
jgi:hypothetical protein